MYRKCPKCGCKRYAHDKRNSDVCPTCGLIFSKWMQKQFNSLGASSGENSGYTSSKQNLVKRFVSPLLYAGNLAGKPRFFGYLLIYQCFFVWG